MRRILCGVDFSEGAREALRVACEFARERHAGLVIVYVEEAPLWQHEPFVHLPVDVRRESLDRSRRELDACTQQARECGVFEVAATLATGSAWDQIVATARADPDIDLVIVGTRGRTGLARALIGSTAERVVRHAPCSVMVVPPPRSA